MQSGTRIQAATRARTGIQLEQGGRMV